MDQVQRGMVCDNENIDDIKMKLITLSFLLQLFWPFIKNNDDGTKSDVDSIMVTCRRNKKKRINRD